jgi:hypothetical protein
MMRTLLLSIALALPSTAAASCAAVTVCSDVSSSLLGGVILDGIRVSWSADDSASDVAGYKLWRYQSTPTSLTFVGWVDATGGPDYSITDEAGDETWTYVLEVWCSSARACAVETVPVPE